MRVTRIGDKLQGQRMRWAGHVERRGDDYPGKSVANVQIDGKRPRGRPARRWQDCVREDLSKLGIGMEDAHDRENWKKLTTVADPK